MLSKWFPGRRYIEREKQQLAALSRRRASNSKSIAREQSLLQAELVRQLGGLGGLSVSFGAGCAAALAYKHREQLGALKSLPWTEIMQVAQEYALAEHAAASAEPTTETTELGAQYSPE